MATRCPSSCSAVCSPGAELTGYGYKGRRGVGQAAQHSAAGQAGAAPCRSVALADGHQVRVQLLGGEHAEAAPLCRRRQADLDV